MQLTINITPQMAEALKRIADKEKMPIESAATIYLAMSIAEQLVKGQAQ